VVRPDLHRGHPAWAPPFANREVPRFGAAGIQVTKSHVYVLILFFFRNLVAMVVSLVEVATKSYPSHRGVLNEGRQSARLLELGIVSDSPDR